MNTITKKKSIETNINIEHNIDMEIILMIIHTLIIEIGFILIGCENDDNIIYKIHYSIHKEVIDIITDTEKNLTDIKRVEELDKTIKILSNFYNIFKNIPLESITYFNEYNILLIQEYQDDIFLTGWIYLCDKKFWIRVCSAKTLGSKFIYIGSTNNLKKMIKLRKNTEISKFIKLAQRLNIKILDIYEVFTNMWDFVLYLNTS
jgi:hypothetical protein